MLHLAHSLSSRLVPRDMCLVVASYDIVCLNPKTFREGSPTPLPAGPRPQPSRERGRTPTRSLREPVRNRKQQVLQPYDHNSHARDTASDPPFEHTSRTAVHYTWLTSLTSLSSMSRGSQNHAMPHLYTLLLLLRARAFERSAVLRTILSRSPSIKATTLASRAETRRRPDPLSP